MSDQALFYLSKAVFGGSIILIIYLVYREWKISKIEAEQAEIKLGEKQDEDVVDSATDAAIIDLINKDIGSVNPSSNTPPKK